MTFSRHGNAKTSFALLIWLNEKVQTILLLLGVEGDLFADFGEHLGGDAKEWGNGIKGQMLYDAGASV